MGNQCAQSLGFTGQGPLPIRKYQVIYLFFSACLVIFRSVRNGYFGHSMWC